jgi:hypothetical protein
MRNRVRIPKKSVELVDLAKRVKDKHLADGDASKLNILNWAELGPFIDEAVALQEKTMQLRRTLMESYQKRDQKSVAIADFLRSSRNILSGAHLKELKVLGQWGFDVLDERSKKSDATDGDSEKKSV